MKKRKMAEPKHELKKVLSYRSILLITINSIMGTGIFFLPAVGARFAGNASLISWIIMSIIAIYISMCFAELTSMFPTSGGVYEFCKQAYGRFTSFIIGWTTIIAGNVTIAMLVVGAIQYLLPIEAPLFKIGICLFFIFAFNYIAYKGMETSAVMLVTFAFVTTSTLILLIIPGLLKLDLTNMTPFFVFPVSSVFFTVFLIAETFFGWETATFLAAETKDGKRVMPKVLITATVIISVICLLSVFTSLTAIPWQNFGSSLAPLTDLGRIHYGPLGGTIFTLMVYLAIIGSVAGWIVSAPRLILAMAEDKLFLSQFAAIHPVNKTPYKAIFFQTGLSTILVIIGSGSYETLLHLLVPVVLVLYSMVLLSMVVLRYKKPNIKRYYTAPFGKIGPIIVSLLLMSFIGIWLHEDFTANLKILKLAASFIALGIPIYFLLQLYYNPKTLAKVNSVIAILNYYTENLFFPKKNRQEIIKLLGKTKIKTILEIEPNVGTLTLHLADHIKPPGQVFATNSSPHAHTILKLRIKKKAHKHVHVLKTKPNQLHSRLPKLDAAVSEGTIGGIENEMKLLRQLNKKMKMNGMIVFLDYDKFFDVIPNIEWLRDDNKIKQVFRNAGFRVKVKRKWTVAWQSIYIFGKKFRNVK